MTASTNQAEHKASLQFERLVFFSDAVFAIAITLLVLDLKVGQTNGVLDMAMFKDRLFGFALSFAVIGAYWLDHHHLFGALHRENMPLRLVNLLFLASVVFLPFPTGVIAEAKLTSTAVILYAWSVAAVGFLLVWLVLVARRPGLMFEGETAGETVRIIIRTLPVPVVFALSTLVATSQPRLATFLWIIAAPANWVSRLAGRRIKTWVDRPKPAP